MGKFKQFFCGHLYEDKEEIFLETVRLSDGSQFPTFSTYSIYVKKQICLKCDKVNYKKLRRLHV